jgi:hypothetical protein
MPAAIFNLEGQYVIEQHATWKAMLFYPGNVTDAKLRGQIRKSYGDPVLLEFRFGQLTYDSETQKTAIPVFLPVEATRRLPDIPPTQSLVYDILMRTSEGEVIRLVQGIAKVSLGATENV